VTRSRMLVLVMNIRRVLMLVLEAAVTMRV
jgi:hypothetical protein